MATQRVAPGRRRWTILGGIYFTRGRSKLGGGRTNHVSNTARLRSDHEGGLFLLIQAFVSLGCRQIHLEQEGLHWSLAGLEPMGALFPEQIEEELKQEKNDIPSSPEAYLVRALRTLGIPGLQRVVWRRWEGQTCLKCWTLLGDPSPTRRPTPSATNLGACSSLCLEFRREPCFPTAALLAYRTLACPATIHYRGRVVNTFRRGFPLAPGPNILEYYVCGGGDFGRLGLRPSGPALIPSGPALNWPVTYLPCNAVTLARHLCDDQRYGRADNYRVDTEQIFTGSCLVMIRQDAGTRNRAWPVQAGLTLDELPLQSGIGGVDVVFCAHLLPVEASGLRLQPSQELQTRLREVDRHIAEALRHIRDLPDLRRTLGRSRSGEKVSLAVAGGALARHYRRGGPSAVCGAVAGLMSQACLHQLRLLQAARRDLSQQ